MENCTKACMVLLGLVLSSAALAQESANFKLEERVFNAGGHPSAGVVFASGSYRVTLDSIGEGLALRGLTGASFGMDGGFVAPYPPPGEVVNLRFTDGTTLVWDPERSVGDYNVYRALLDTLSGLAYGDCLEPELPGESAIDLDTPPAETGFFYLVTAENRLDEEGSKGFDSTGAERANPAPCP